MGLLREAHAADSLDVTEAEAETALLDYFRDFPGKLLREWDVLNRLCARGTRLQNRVERRLFLRVMVRMAKEKKLIRYRKGLNRGKIRISEAFVSS